MQQSGIQCVICELFSLFLCCENLGAGMEVDRSKRLYVILNRYTSVRWCVATYQRLYVPTYIRINVIVSVSIARQTIVRNDRYNYLFPYVTMYNQANDCAYAYTINYTANAQIYHYS